MATQQTEIGRFPIEWRVPSFGDVFDIQQGKQVSKSNREGGNQKPFLRTANVIWGSLELAELDYMHFSERDEDRLTLKFRDLLVCEGGAIGRTAVWRDELEGCYYQNHLHRLRAKEGSKVIPEFALYWLWYGFEFAKVYSGHGNVTTIPNLSQSRLKQMLLPLPDEAEQRQIARVLATVQRAIEQQQAIVATTRELKRSLMHKLFTEGLRGEAPKQTEIGLVPESWLVVPLTQRFDTQLGKMLSQKAKQGNSPCTYLRNKNVQWGYIDTTDLLTMDFSAQEKLKFELRTGDLLVCEGGEPGRAAIWQGEIEDCYFQKALHRVRPKDGRSKNRFLAHWLNYALAIRNLYGVSGASSTIAHLPAAQLRALPIPCPQRDEQDEIMAILATLDDKLALAERKLGHYNELFKTLLHQLMTTQLRVHDLDLDALGVPALD